MEYFYLTHKDKEIEKQLFDILDKKYTHILEKVVKENNLIDKIPKYSKYNAVLIEPRNLQILKFTLYNYIYFLNGLCNFYIFCSENNILTIKEIFNNNSNIHYINLNKTNLTPLEYSNLFYTPEFYDNFDGEKMLIFHADSYLRRKGIEDYFKFDNIGAPAGIIDCKNNIFGMNGGLCIRNIEMCKQNLLHINKQNELEDMEFSQIFHNLKNAILPTFSEAQNFSLESIFTSYSIQNSIGCHKPHHALILSPLIQNFEYITTLQF